MCTLLPFLGTLSSPHTLRPEAYPLHADSSLPSPAPPFPPWSSHRQEHVVDSFVRLIVGPPPPLPTGYTLFLWFRLYSVLSTYQFI